MSEYEAAMLRLTNGGFSPEEAAELLADPQSFGERQYNQFKIAHRKPRISASTGIYTDLTRFSGQN